MLSIMHGTYIQLYMHLNIDSDRNMRTLEKSSRTVLHVTLEMVFCDRVANARIRSNFGEDTVTNSPLQIILLDDSEFQSPHTNMSRH